MNAPPSAQAGNDPADLLAAIDSGLARAFVRLQEAPAGEAATASLTLGLELRSKLEELLVLPALYDAGLILRPDYVALEAEIDDLREASADLADPAAQAAARTAAVAALHERSRRHALRVEGLLLEGRDRASFDGPRLAEAMLAMISRWQQEIARTGDIEDEERDPVGQPPR